MQKDADLLKSVKPQQSLLHFYQWRSCSFSYGHFIKPQLLLDTEKAMAEGIEFAKRPTGGGILFHGADFAFSFLAACDHSLYGSNQLESYKKINHLTQLALQPFVPAKIEQHLAEANFIKKKSPTFCWAEPTIYDLMVDGQKLAGAAQRRKKWGLLQQTSILYQPLEHGLLDLILDPVLQKKCLVSWQLNLKPSQLKNRLYEIFTAASA